MIEYKKISFEDFINDIHEYSKDGILYTINGRVDPNQSVIVSFNIYSDAPILQYSWTLPCSDIEDILINLKYQTPSPSVTDYVQAINYYLENDAFIDWEKAQNFLAQAHR